MSTMVEEITNGLNEKIENKFNELNEKAFGGSRITEVLMDKQVEKSTEMELRSKAYADSFVNEWARTGRISDKAIEYFQSSVEANGGHLVPQDLLTSIIRKATKIAKMRDLATVYKTQRNELEIIVEKVADGFQASWSTETGDKVDTTVEGFDKVTVTCHDIYAKPMATLRNLSDNAFDLEAYIVEKVGEAFGTAQGNAFLLGDGNGKPTGLLNGLTATALGTSSKVTFAELNNLVYSLKQKYADNGVFLMHRTTLGEINGITDLQGNPIFRQPEIRQEGAKVDGYLLNIPVMLDDNMPSIKTAVADDIVIVFGDIKSAYAIVDHDGVYMERDSLTKTGYVKFPTIARTGGKRILDEAVVALKQI